MNMYTRFFVVEHKKIIFLHPHAHKFCIIVVAFVGLYGKAANNVTDVLLKDKEVTSSPLSHTSIKYFLCLPIIYGIDNPNHKWLMINSRICAERWLEYLLKCPVFVAPLQKKPFEVDMLHLVICYFCQCML
jgi:hypothetical protein